MQTNINSYVMHVAHAMAGRLPDKKLRAPWSVYVRNGWFAVSLRKALKAGVFEFEYIKNNGETRLALGTLHPLLIPEEDRPKGAPDYQPNYRAIAYYDINKKAWRSFNIDAFLTAGKIYSLLESPL